MAIQDRDSALSGIMHEVDTVFVTVESVVIPTYPIGEPDRNPMFLEKRVYQGSSGVVYPHPVIEQVADNSEDRSYTVIYLENRYLKIMLLPELGGRVQMALDKTNGYHFVYYNRVIKPALVGLAGPWISGGIEFNWPQHHRPSTFEPVEYWIDEHADGSKTVWFNEIERMFRTKGMAGFRLYPGRAYLEISAQLYNRTSLPQTFLWWANPAVHVNDDYQSIFPPDVYAVMDHGKRAVSTFPIATGEYYKVNYAPGTDISRYKNIPVPTSYMAHHSDFDFLGCYDHGRQAGMLHVANHHLVPGKKQWTWGSGDFGQAWDRQLTDADGPYIELMCGAFTDNQPDFSWLQPGEEKRFTQIFMPFKELGGVKNASSEVAVNLEVQGERITYGVYSTRQRLATVELIIHGAPVISRNVTLSPEHALLGSATLPAGAAAQQVTLRVVENGRELITFTPLPEERPEPPQPATAAPPPEMVTSNEALFFHGLHLEQYRHATYEPETYYEEALRREPLDSRCNNAMGRLLLRRGKFAEAESYFRTAVQSITRRNPNPYDGEPYYNLGLALRHQARLAEAYDAFFKAAWSAAWQDAAWFELACIASARSNDTAALQLLDDCLARNGRHHGARHLQVALLRRNGQTEAARRASQYGLANDILNYGLHYERQLLDDDRTFATLLHNNVHSRAEVALDYAHAGLLLEADEILEEILHDHPAADPMVAYYQGWVRTLANDHESARRAFSRAKTLPPDFCFPNQVECIAALETAMAVDPTDARAPYYLGNFWYAHKRYAEAIACWELAATLDPDFPTVQRNLGLAYVNKLGDLAVARTRYEHAFALAPQDARVFFELDQLYKRLRMSPVERLARLHEQATLVDRRDDLTIETVTLLNLTGRHAEALQRLLARTFHPWEGGEGKVTGQYVIAQIELAQLAISDHKPDAAIRHLTSALLYPENLGEGRLAGERDHNIYYWLGQAYRAQGDEASARRHFERATAGAANPAAALYYNDQPPETLYYQALAHRALGNEEAATALSARLIQYGEDHLDDQPQIDYFAVSLPDFLVFDDDLALRNRIHCLYLIALGQLGAGANDKADAFFAQVLELDPSHLGATLHRRHIEL